MRPINCLIIHHSATPSGSVQQFTAEHKARGFGTIGYHWLIGNGHGTSNGELCQGRPEAIKGCGVFGANTGKIHICCVGNFHSPDVGYFGPPTKEQFDTLGHWLLTKGRQFDIPYNRILGHREAAIPGHATACPGDQMPLSHVRDWYRVSQKAIHLGQQVATLSNYLSAALPSAPSFRGVQVAIDRGPEQSPHYPQKTLVSNGKVYLEVDELAVLMNWPQPNWDAVNRRVTLLTRTP